MKTLLARLERALAQGKNTVLVTVIASSGSTPRGAGARMLVVETGLLAGTIGGGAVEHRCIAEAKKVLGSDKPVQTSFELNPADTANLGMVCGGRVTVHFLPLTGGDVGTIDLCHEAAARFAAGTPFWLFTPLTEGNLALWPEDGTFALSLKLIEDLPPEPVIRSDGAREWFSEQIQRPGTVYIFGGGHVAQALVPVLVPIDFPCVVLEDRAEFADPAIFPLARSARLVDFDDPEAYEDITEDDYVCVMTRGHQKDLVVQRRALDTPARYIGVIGSAKKKAACFHKLRAMGAKEEDLGRIVTPIGLSIGGRSPAEIAISIAAQLIQYRSSLARKEETI